LLTAQFILEAIVHAEDKTIIWFGANKRNDKSDAFRHAYFNALNAQRVNPMFVASLGLSHESEVPEHLSLEVDMDLFNNERGILIGLDNATLTESELSIRIHNYLLEGNLVYLSPLDQVVFPNYGINALTFLTPTDE